MKYFTAEEIARKLSISTEQVHSLINQEKLKEIKIINKKIGIPETFLKNLKK